MSHVNPRSILERDLIATHVEKLANSPAVVMHESDSLADAVSIMRERRMGSVLVVGNAENEIAGIVTERDVLNQAWSDEVNPSETALSSAMTKNVESLKYFSALGKALFLMSTGGYRHLPIIGRELGQVGLLSTTDVLQYFHRHLIKPIFSQKDPIVVDDNKVDLFFSGTLEVLRLAPPVTVPFEATIADALREMTRFRTGSVLVATPNGDIRGVFTERDFLLKHALERKVHEKLRMSEVMTADPKTLFHQSTVGAAIELMVVGGFRHLPIVDHIERPVGLFSVRNVIDYLAHALVDELRRHNVA